MNVRRWGAGLAGAAVGIAVVTTASRVVGFGRWLTFSGTVGSTEVGTSYATANQLPNVLFEVAAGGALAGAVVPLLAGPIARAAGATGSTGVTGSAGARAEVDRIASALLTWTIGVLLPVSVLLAVASGPLARILLPPDADPAQEALTVRLMLVFSPQVVLYGVGVVLTGVLQAHRRFLWPAFVPLLSSVVMISGYAMFAATARGTQGDAAALPSVAEAWLGWGTTAAVAAISLPLLLPTRAVGVRLRPTLRFGPGVASRARALAAAGIGTLLAQQAAVLATVVLANDRGGNGAYPIFQYAQAVYFLPYAILAVPLATSAFPRLATLASTGDRAGYARTVASTTRAVVVTSALGAVALVAAAPAVAGVFQQLDRGSVTGLSAALTAMAPGLIGFGLIAHLGRALYAAERGRAAVIATATGWATVVVASLIAVRRLTADGADVAAAVLALGIGNSVGMTVAGIALVIALARTAGPLALAGLPRTVVGIVVGAAGGIPAGRAVTEAIAAAWSGIDESGAGSGVGGAGVGGAVVAGVVGAAVGGLVLLSIAAVVDRESSTALVRRRHRSETVDS